MATERREDGLPRATAEAARPVIKLIALSNAGGAVASMTLIGATAKSGGLENILALPLGLFSLGVFAAILYAAILYLRVAEYEGFEPDPPRWLICDRVLRASGYAGIAFFLMGSLFGVLIVACA
ncbi:MAG: hypothetical protein MI741_14890 [Rhodospirillales bacterium]|nr:hypothetical protein [Rhodospirillales bacterium]